MKSDPDEAASWYGNLVIWQFYHHRVQNQTRFTRMEWECIWLQSMDRLAEIDRRDWRRREKDDSEENHLTLVGWALIWKGKDSIRNVTFYIRPLKRPQNSTPSRALYLTMHYYLSVSALQCTSLLFHRAQRYSVHSVKQYYSFDAKTNKQTNRRVPTSSQKSVTEQNFQNNSLFLGIWEVWFNIWPSYWEHGQLPVFY